MERLTTDKPNGMYELAHNSCYVGDDGTARYRDFETDESSIYKGTVFGISS